MLGGHAGFLILCTSVPLCKRSGGFFLSFFIKAKFLNDVGRGFIRSDHKKVWTEKLSYRKWVWVLALLPLCLCACVCVRCLCFVLSPDGFVLSLRGWCQERLLCFSGKKKIWTLTLIDRSNGQKHLWKQCVQMFLCQFVLTLTYIFRTASCRTCMWTNDEDLEVVKKKLHSFKCNTTTKNDNTNNKWILKIVITLILLIILLYY